MAELGYDWKDRSASFSERSHGFGSWEGPKPSDFRSLLFATFLHSVLPHAYPWIHCAPTTFCVPGHLLLFCHVSFPCLLVWLTTTHTIPSLLGCLVSCSPPLYYGKRTIEEENVTFISEAGISVCLVIAMVAEQGLESCRFSEATVHTNRVFNTLSNSYKYSRGEMFKGCVGSLQIFYIIYGVWIIFSTFGSTLHLVSLKLLLYGKFLSRVILPIC